MFVVTFKKAAERYVPESFVPSIYEAKKLHQPIMIGEDVFDSNEILYVQRHVQTEGKTAKDILHEFQGQEREWVRWRIANRMEKVGKALTAEEARRFVASVRDNPDLAPC